MDSVRSHTADEIVNMMKRTPLFMTEVDDLGGDGGGMFWLSYSLPSPSPLSSAAAVTRSIALHHEITSIPSLRMPSRSNGNGWDLLGSIS